MKSGGLSFGGTANVAKDTGRIFLTSHSASAVRLA